MVAQQTAQLTFAPWLGFLYSTYLPPKEPAMNMNMLIFGEIEPVWDELFPAE